MPWGGRALEKVFWKNEHLGQNRELRKNQVGKNRESNVRQRRDSTGKRLEKRELWFGHLTWIV